MIFLLLLINIVIPLSGLTGFADSTVNVTLNEVITDDPLPVVLSSFTVAVTSDLYVEMQWVTETEMNMLGYNVFRGQELDLSSTIKINETIIPSQNTSQTSVYSFIDDDVETGGTYFYWLQMMEMDLDYSFQGPVSVTVEKPGDEGETPEVEYVTALEGVYPNPFNPKTTIMFSLAEDAKVTLTIFNVRGQVLGVLAEDEPLGRGSHRVIWNGLDRDGKPASSGIYFYRMQTDDGYEEVKKMTILK
jgi:hypothetical protein